MSDPPCDRGVNQPLDTRRHELFVNILPKSVSFTAMLNRRVQSPGLECRVAIWRKSPNEMLQLAIEPLDESPDAILEEVVSGPTSIVVQFTTAATIVGELESLEQEYALSRSHTS